MGRLDDGKNVSDFEIGKYLARSINLFAAGETELACKLQDHARLLMRQKMETAILFDESDEFIDTDEIYLSA